NFSEQESSLPEKIHRCSWYVLDGCACGCYNQGTLAFPARPSGRDMRRDKSNFLVGLSLWSSELKPASRGLFRCCLFRHVWMAPAWQGFFARVGCGQLRSCVRLVDAA